LVSVDEMRDHATGKTRLWDSGWDSYATPRISRPEKYCLRGMNLFCKQFLHVVIGESMYPSPKWSGFAFPQSSHHFVCFALLPALLLVLSGCACCLLPLVVGVCLFCLGAVVCVAWLVWLPVV
jgi:hypothetical protein